MEHTKEPWRLGRFTGPKSYEEVRETVGNMDVVVDTDNGPYVLAACNINFPENARANARRIVACVNACEGISDEALDSWMNPPEGMFGHPHGPWPAHIISLQRAAENAAQQRDELLDLCRQLYEAEQTKNQQDWTAVISALEKIGAAGTVHNAELRPPSPLLAKVAP